MMAAELAAYTVIHAPGFSLKDETLSKLAVPGSAGRLTSSHVLLRTTWWRV
jgi:hypothetical protein